VAGVTYLQFPIRLCFSAALPELVFAVSLFHFRAAEKETFFFLMNVKLDR